MDSPENPNDFRFHSDLDTLDGTNYFEFVPGPCTGEHWQPGSRFIYHSTFYFIEFIFERHIPGFDHCSFVEVRRPEWDRIIADVAALRVDLDKTEDPAVVMFTHCRSQWLCKEFEEHLEANRRGLVRLLAEFETWLRDTLGLVNVITVLGM